MSRNPKLSAVAPFSWCLELYPDSMGAPLSEICVDPRSAKAGDVVAVILKAVDTMTHLAISPDISVLVKELAGQIVAVPFNWLSDMERDQLARPLLEILTLAQANPTMMRVHHISRHRSRYATYEVTLTPHLQMVLPQDIIEAFRETSPLKTGTTKELCRKNIRLFGKHPETAHEKIEHQPVINAAADLLCAYWSDVDEISLVPPRTLPSSSSKSRKREKST